ncbi:hypothetical protein MmiHf6_17060 [Methanimicrococcus hongohii]|uniref:Uncharacterized protein n=1 Tax=Methanimicrococcus hongohii TaxID=3028295 RepID=A0AA96V2W6_9EURY|nr:hypothetical protein [Methanimicrococcus sp. Hf6]WNY24375.1 hypothetical protein MmiHf6_17060 [Methanimicrococcus sp. Hf6]
MLLDSCQACKSATVFKCCRCNQVCVSACVAVCVSACICSFLKNPFAFANVPPLPTDFCFRCYLQVSVSAATVRFAFPLLPTGLCFRLQVGFAPHLPLPATRYSCPPAVAAAARRPREPLHFSFYFSKPLASLFISIKNSSFVFQNKLKIKNKN